MKKSLNKKDADLTRLISAKEKKILQLTIKHSQQSAKLNDLMRDINRLKLELADLKKGVVRR